MVTLISLVLTLMVLALNTLVRLVFNWSVFPVKPVCLVETGVMNYLIAMYSTVLTQEYLVMGITMALTFLMAQNYTLTVTLVTH